MIEELGDSKKRIKRQIDTLKKAFDKDEADSQSSESLNSTKETDNSFPTYVLISIGAILSVCAFPIIKYAGHSLVWGEQSLARSSIEKWRSKHGKPQVPTGVTYRHNKAFEELSAIGERLAKFDDEKFDNKEFLLFVRIKIALSKNDPECQLLNHSAQLLKAGIVTQKSFLRIEQTELRFRSSQQQKLYNFVVDNLTKDLDKQQFRDGIEQKLAEVLPLLNTEEGKTALLGYVKEINLIAEQQLGLKLLRLFKQYNLADYSILKTVSDIIDRLKGRDLRDSQELVGIVIENFEIFDKIAPIIEIPQGKSEPKTHANLIQYIGLINRHEKSYYDFSKLLEFLEKWQKPYRLLTTIRTEYTANNYRLPK
ncbi:hypothetical protein [Myxosarcina sp. GI1(2024)]